MKGQAMSISQIFVALMTIGLVALLILLFFTKYFDVKSIIEESSGERRAITLAQVFLSSTQLVHVDDVDVVYRAIFDKEKLDEKLINDAKKLEDFNYLYDVFTDNPLFHEISYPNSTYVLHVEDLETNDKWITFGYGDMSGLNFDTTDYVNYLVQTSSLDVSDYFGFKGLVLKNDVIQKKFPVTIRISDGEVHVGIMTLLSTEL